MDNDSKDAIMWIFTGGSPASGDVASFISAVQHRDYPELLVVRARDRESLDGLLEQSAFTPVDDVSLDAVSLLSGEAIEGGSTDYPFRIFVLREALQAYLARQVEDLDYTNFKSQAVKTRPGRVWHDALYDVWSAMHGVSPVAASRR